MPTRSVVVIGASAGGLEGLVRIVRGLPADLPAAVFVVVHLARWRPSQLARILGAASPLSVVAVTGEEPIVPGRIYVAVPDRHLVIERGRVRSTYGAVENRHRPSIDVLFRSAAIAYGPATVGVVLSGTLNDGTAGLRWIKRAGGCAVVQNPADALFAAMPESAIANVDVDRVLPAEQIADAIAELARDPGKEEPMTNGHVDAQGAPLGNGGPPSAFICPDCGGTLFERDEGTELRYRCRVGHAYAPEALHDAQELNVDDSLWTAVRALTEHADLSRRLSQWAGDAGLGAAARRFARSADDSERKAEMVRRAIVPETTAAEDAVH